GTPGDVEARPDIATATAGDAPRGRAEATATAAPPSTEAATPRLADEATSSPASSDAVAERPAPVPLEARSAWGRKLARGVPVVSVELQPPHGWARAELLGPARALKVA